MSNLCVADPLIYEFPILPDPGIEPVLEAEDDCQAHNADSHSPTYCPEISFRFIRVDNTFKIHPEVRSEEG